MESPKQICCRLHPTHPGPDQLGLAVLWHLGMLKSQRFHTQTQEKLSFTTRITQQAQLTHNASSSTE